MPIDQLSLSSDTITTYLYVGLTVLLAVFLDNSLRSLVKVPKHFDNRRARRATAVTKTVITVFVYAVATYIVLALLGVDLTPLLASATFIAIMLSIGARPIIEDFVTGVFLLSQTSIAIGDYVKVGETEGYIDSIDARTLTMVTESGALHIIPNSQVKELANYSRTKITTVIELPVKANQSISIILSAAEKALEALQKDDTLANALFASESRIDGIEDFKATEIMTIRISLVTYPLKRWDVSRAYRFLVKKEFEKAKIHFA